MAAAKSISVRDKTRVIIGPHHYTDSMADRSVSTIFCALFVAIYHHAGGEIVKGSVNLNSGVFDKVSAVSFSGHCISYLIVAGS